MAREFSEYRFDDLTTPIASYDPTKINLGFCMKKGTDSYGRDYVSPLENKFFRIYETYGELSGAVGSLEYNSNITWFFHANPANIGGGVRKIYMHIYDKTLDTMTFQGTISVTPYGSAQTVYSMAPSLEKHTTGTISVSGTIVTGIGTSWKTDGACVGNRIGFGNTDPSQITTWYQISSLTNDGQIILTESVGIISAGTPYVIEDFRLVYVNYNNGSTTASGLTIAKGLRPEIFTLTSTTIPLSTTVDNIRAVYRLSNATTSSYLYFGNVLTDKISLTEQYSYTTTGTSTIISIQKFNIRAALIVSAGSSTNAFILSTGNATHSGTAYGGANPACKAIYGGIENIFLCFQTRISRVIPSNITSGSTTFISDFMVENPPGGVSTFALTSNLRSISWMPLINKFMVTGTYSGTANRIFVFSYSPGGTFERAISTIDTIQSSSYSSFDIDTYSLSCVSNVAQYFDMSINNGIAMFSRYIADNNGIMMTFVPEADAAYESITNAHVITPEISTITAVSLSRLRIDSERTRNANYTLYPREYYRMYYRTSGISDNSGIWNDVRESGDLTGIPPTSGIQFKIVFRTMGISTVADKIYGIILSYDTNNDPPSTTFYEPSIAFSDETIGKVAWRQRALWETTNIPDLRIKMYDTSTVTLILTDNTSSTTEGVWEYSTDSGTTWNAWSVSANAIGNYIRYTPYSAIGLGVNVKIKLYKI